MRKMLPWRDCILGRDVDSSVLLGVHTENTEDMTA